MNGQPAESARPRSLLSGVSLKALAFLVIGPLLAALGSSSSHAQDRQVRVDTLATGRVVVSNPDPAATVQGDALELVEELRIGSAFGADTDAPELFGEVVSLAVDEDGNTYVADFQSREIHMFDRAGNFVRTIGRRGEGPGEFRMLAGILWDGGSRVLWALDVGGRRFNAFDRSGGLSWEHSPMAETAIVPSSPGRATPTSTAPSTTSSRGISTCS